MEQRNIENLLHQIQEGKIIRSYVYHCCGQEFTNLYEFRKHLHEEHPQEMSLYFEGQLHREAPSVPSRDELHKIVKKGQRIKEKERDRKEKRQASKRNRDAYPTPNKGDYFRLIYTPMGNKK